MSITALKAIIFLRQTSNLQFMEKGIKRIFVLLKNHEEDLSWNNGNIKNWVEAWYELVYCILEGSKGPY
jgi:hypothetical protein